MKLIWVALLPMIFSTASAQMVDGEITHQYGPLIDSLITFIGQKPYAIQRNVGMLRDGTAEPTTKGWVITLSMNTQRGRFAVLHEFGHYFNAVRGDVFYAYLDSLNLNKKFDRTPGPIWERFADDFAWAWIEHQNGWNESMRPGADLLRRLLWPCKTEAHND